MALYKRLRIAPFFVARQSPESTALFGNTAFTAMNSTNTYNNTDTDIKTSKSDPYIVKKKKIQNIKIYRSAKPANDKREAISYDSSIKYVKLSDIDKTRQKDEVKKNYNKNEICIAETKLHHKFSKTFKCYIPINTELSFNLCRIIPEFIDFIGMDDLLNLASKLGHQILNIDHEEFNRLICYEFGGIQSDPDYGIKLGADLLQILEKEISTDVIIECSGRRFRTHKNILSARTPYFARVLSDDSENVIRLEGYTSNAVDFVLKCIYGGAKKIPHSVDVMEIIQLADELGMECLTDLVISKMEQTLCHNFHEPCDVCLDGVLSCLPVSKKYSLDDLYYKCLNWLTKHFVDIWPTETFAKMPTNIIETVCNEQKVTISSDNLINVVHGCQQIDRMLPQNKWADVVRRCTVSLLQCAENYAVCNLSLIFECIVRSGNMDLLQDANIRDWFSNIVRTLAPNEVSKLCNILSELSNLLLKDEVTILEDIRKEYEKYYRETPTLIDNVSSKHPKGRNILKREKEVKSISKRELVVLNNLKMCLEMFKSDTKRLSSTRLSESVQKQTTPHKVPIVRTTRAQTKRYEFITNKVATMRTDYMYVPPKTSTIRRTKSTREPSIIQRVPRRSHSMRLRTDFSGPSSCRLFEPPYETGARRRSMIPVRKGATIPQYLLF